MEATVYTPNVLCCYFVLSKNFKSLEAVPHFGKCCSLNVDCHSARIPPAGDHLQKKSKGLGPDGLPANTIRQNGSFRQHFWRIVSAVIPHKDTRACHPNALVRGSRRSTSSCHVQPMQACTVVWAVLVPPGYTHLHGFVKFVASAAHAAHQIQTNLSVWTWNDPVAPWHTDSIPCKGAKVVRDVRPTCARNPGTTLQLRNCGNSREATICARREPQIPTILAGQGHRCSYTKFRMSWWNLCCVLAASQGRVSTAGSVLL